MLISPQLLIYPVSNRYLFTPGSGISSTTWDPAHKGTTLTLSGGNLTGTGSSPTGNEANVRTNVSHTTGTYYAKFTIVTLTTDIIIGGISSVGPIGDPAAGKWLGGNGNSFGYDAVDNAIYSGGSSAGAGAGTYTSGDVIEMLWDLDHGNVQYAKNGGSYSSLVSASLSDPPFYIALQLFNGDVVTADFTTAGPASVW